VSAWTVAPVALKVAGKNGPTDHIVAGWINGPFGLDFRVFTDDVVGDATPGFMLTHLPTGFVVRALIAVGMKEAMALADEILDSADWTSPATPTPEQCAAVKMIMADYPGVVTSALRHLAPAA
jgi:hypothetical protein